MPMYSRHTTNLTTAAGHPSRMWLRGFRRKSAYPRMGGVTIIAHATPSATADTSLFCPARSAGTSMPPTFTKHVVWNRMGWYSSLVFSLPFFTMDVATAWSANGIRVDNTHMRALRAHGNASLLCSCTGLSSPVVRSFSRSLSAVLS